MSNVERVVNVVENTVYSLPDGFLDTSIGATERAAALIALGGSIEQAGDYEQVGARLQEALDHGRLAWTAMEEVWEELVTYKRAIVGNLGTGDSIAMGRDSKRLTSDTDADRPLTGIDRHTQRMPQEWLGLVALSDRLIAEGHSTEEAARLLYGELSRLTGQQLDENRYYALGEVISGMTQRLRDPRTREEAIDAAVRSIVEKHKEYCLINDKPKGAGVYRYELSPHNIGIGVSAAVRQAFDALPPGVRLLSDVMNAYEGALRTGGPEAITTHLTSIYTLPESITGRDYTVKSIRINAFSAIVTLYNLALSTWLPEDKRDENMPVYDIIDPATLRTINLVQASMSAARYLHADEIDTHKLRAYTEIRGKGELHFNKRAVPKEPERLVGRPEQLFDKYPAVHDQRIGCPAGYVGRAIPTLLSMMPDIIERANAQIVSREKRNFYM